MARPRKTIPMEASVNMCDLSNKIASIPDEKLGAWLRKAVTDWQNGCADKNEDEFIRKLFKKAFEKMNSTQKTQAQKYKNKINRNKNDQEIKISTNDDGSIRPETDDSARTTNLPEVASKSGTIKSGKKAYGQNKNVMLTDEEGTHLRELYGEDLKMAIDILDAYIENGGKKAKRYKDHAAVMRRGNWVWNRVIETKNNEARLEKTNRPANLKDFKSMREEEQKRRAFTSLYDKEVL